MKLVIGLGNSGEKYKNNRHNVGFIVLDKLAQDLGFMIYELREDLKSYILNRNSFILAKPTTFMNNSGEAVKKLVAHFRVNLSNLWVIHDDLDLRLGEYKIQKGIGPKLHYGVQSVEKELGTKDFWRVRVGVDNRNSKDIIKGEKYVLMDFDKTEMGIRNEVIERVVDELIKKLKFSIYVN